MPEPALPPGASRSEAVEDQPEDKENQEADQVSSRQRAGKRAEFEKRIKEMLQSGECLLDQVGGEILEALPLLNTCFGDFGRILKTGEADKVEASGPGAHDLLPIPIRPVLRANLGANKQEQQWVALSCYSLNFWYCTGWDRPTALEHLRDLTQAQEEFLVKHVLPAIIRRMLEGNPSMPKLEDLEKILF